MARAIFPYESQHLEVDWIDRHIPPAPNMILLEQRYFAGGTRMMLVWGRHELHPLKSGEIVYWSEPN